MARYLNLNVPMLVLACFKKGLLWPLHRRFAMNKSMDMTGYTIVKSDRENAYLLNTCSSIGIFQRGFFVPKCKS